MEKIYNLHVKEIFNLSTPNVVKEKFTATKSAVETVLEGRHAIREILEGKDKRMLMITGPCSIHHVDGAIEFAQRLMEVREQLRDKLEIVMRVYFEKPRTTVGWKGLVNDPHMNGTYDIEHGLKTARQLLCHINELGMPTATEFLDPIKPQYYGDLVAWAAIGARTIESQTHREMASGLSMPVGFKNGTDGSLETAIQAMSACSHPHSFLGVDNIGVTSVIRTTGNPWSHLILRGGRKTTNYDPQSIASASEQLNKAWLRPLLMVDCSHANSGKKHVRQEYVWKNVLAQRVAGQKALMGLMTESYLQEGSQPIPKNGKGMQYGISVTDECVSWETISRMLHYAHSQL